MQTHRQKFITGALILITANTASKILGAVFKIPLTYILNEEGMALYNTAFQAYVAVMSLATAGFLFSGSKIISERLALDDRAGAGLTVGVLLRLLAVFGLGGSLLLWFGADFLAAALHEPLAADGMRVLAPAIFFVAAGIAYKAYYQGASNMIPTALSQVTEAVIKLAAGFALAVMFAGNIQKCASGALLGVTIGEIIATGMLFLMYLPTRKCLRSAGTAAISSHELTGMIFATAVPLLLMSAASNALSLADTALIRRALVSVRFAPEHIEIFTRIFPAFSDIAAEIRQTGTLSDHAAGALYGAYTGYALTIFHLPIGVTATFSVSVLPLISGALALGDKAGAARHTRTLLSATVTIAVPSAICVGVLAHELLALLFGNTASAPMLALVAPGIVFIAADGAASAVLQAAGYAYRSFAVMIAVYAVKFAANIALISRPELNILGAVLASDICFFVGMVLDLRLLSKAAGLNVGLVKIFAPPTVSGAAMAAVMVLLSDYVRAGVSSTIGVICALGAAGAAAYMLAFMLSGGVRFKGFAKSM